MKSFSRKIIKLGINPCVDVPRDVLTELHRHARKNSGPIPVRGRLNGKRFRQTVVKYRGRWRLYLNTTMRSDAGLAVGDIARIEIEFDPRPRPVPMHPLLDRALEHHTGARAAFEKLSPSRRKEILRYLHSLKQEESVRRTVAKVIRQLSRKNSVRPGRQHQTK